ncbi:MAG: DUF1972 domain-containing protein [Ornithinimicrobium sp.]
MDNLVPQTGAGESLSIALIGTRGVPAHYGGFETAVEEVGKRLARRGHRVVVYCRREKDVNDAALPSRYEGMELVHLPAVRRRSLETLSHTGLAVSHLRRHPTDVAVVFNAANAPWLPLLRAARIPVATHVDGLEWKRSKWGPTGRRYYLAAEKLAVRWSDALIADAPGIAAYYLEKFGVISEQISYGAPRITRHGERLAEVGLSERGFHLCVARFEPENHVDLIVDGYSRSSASLPLVVVGSAPYADEYTKRVHQRADERVKFLGGVWDQELLDDLYAGAQSYLHGHSVGGTNPSLLRAMGAGAAVDAFDVVFNHDVLGSAGRFFTDASDVATLVEHAEADPDAARRRGEQARARAGEYDWDDVTDRYEGLCHSLKASTQQRVR